MRSKQFIGRASVLAGIVWVVMLLFKDSHALSFVPDALGVTSVTYSKDESPGFGPGANEAGIVTYPLSDGVAREIMAQGLAYFLQMPPNADQQERAWRGAYGGWQPTPVPPETPEFPRPGPARFDMLDYVSKYLSIDVDPQVVAQVNAILNTPGAYYAYGRIGMIVVSPRRNLVIYLYNG